MLYARVGYERMDGTKDELEMLHENDAVAKKSWSEWHRPGWLKVVYGNVSWWVPIRKIWPVSL